MSVVHAEPLTFELDATRQFDFWVGEWDCVWSDEHEWHAGTNTVYLDLGGAVVVESFDGRPSLEYQGLSFSVYDRAAHCWKQTWVDSVGNYLDFAGSFENGVMELRRHGEVDGSPRDLPDALGEHRVRLARLVVAALRRRRRDLDVPLGDRVQPCPIAGSTRTSRCSTHAAKRNGSQSGCSLACAIGNPLRAGFLIALDP